jgi:hypothetical protein
LLTKWLQLWLILSCCDYLSVTLQTRYNLSPGLRLILLKLVFFIFLQGGLLAFIGTIGFMLALRFTANEPKNQLKRLGKKILMMIQSKDHYYINTGSMTCISFRTIEGKDARNKFLSG